MVHGAEVGLVLADAPKAFQSHIPTHLPPATSEFWLLHGPDITWHSCEELSLVILVALGAPCYGLRVYFHGGR